MHRFTFAASIVVVVVVVGGHAKPQPDSGAGPIPGLPREFQNINIENYLRNAKAVQFQLKCVVHDGPCDTIGKFLKKNIPTWLRTQCENCNDESKKLAGKLITFFQENYPKDWDDAVTKFGSGSFSDEEIARFEKELGVKIIRDPNAPTRAPNAKPDHALLASLAKEGIEAAKTTKEPIILSRDSTTQVVPTVR